ncbi:hypothetical protein CH296_15865 [Rhodococcus sp. 14-2496-1d]|uniref:hypothetical protein n=1 Tax=Rhodococcus sp. 14-2496-1d TaxID=2023146 RepID=UPI000B9C2D8F|nr:hypothetical protein [Rhodococcus sp. 14-2496-1d]OZF31624.1 hypothetical protein CH296_15865 [Rhodococcus sp. 14-2496-1d]
MARLTRFGLLAAAFAAVSTMAFAPVAQAQPPADAPSAPIENAPPPGPVSVPVLQIPNLGVTVGGLVVPDQWIGTIEVASTETPGQTHIWGRAAEPRICASYQNFASLQVDFVNIANGRTGSVNAPICQQGNGVFVPSGPVVADTGSGPILFTAHVLASGILFDIPGVGGFSAP